MGIVELVVVLGIALVAGAGAVAVAVGRNRDRRNQVVAGVPTSAPASWAGSHVPEARLHRRLRAAAASAAAVAKRPVDPLWSARQAVEEAALAVDERLVAVAAVPERERGPLLVDVTAQVAAVERAAARLLAPKEGAVMLDEVNTALERIALLDQARAEVERAAQPWSPPEEDDGTAGGTAGGTTSSG